MAEQVKLLGFWASPFSCRVEIALKLKGIEYEHIQEDLSNKSPLLLKSNPVHKKIPVLVHNGKPIAESQVILEHIDETWKQNPLLPQQPYDRAMARFWAKFVDEKVFPAAWKAVREGQEAIEEAKQQLKFLEDELKGKDFFGGETIGYVDIVAFTIIYWLVRVQEIFGTELLTEQKFPILFKWTERVIDIDVVNKCVPPKDKHIAVIKARLGPAKSANN